MQSEELSKARNICVLRENEERTYCPYLQFFICQGKFKLMLKELGLQKCLVV